MVDARGTIRITESRVLAAMAHPLRRRLLDLLHVEGPATASVLARATDQAVGNASHHLRVLADAGLIEEAPELARDRRERWWRRASESIRWSTSDFEDNPTAEVVARAADSLNFEHHVDVVRRWQTASDAVRAGWEQSAFSTDHWLSLTPAELSELGEEIVALLRRWQGRGELEDGQERDTVFAFAVGVPGRP